MKLLSNEKLSIGSLPSIDLRTDMEKIEDACERAERMKKPVKSR